MMVKTDHNMQSIIELKPTEDCNPLNGLLANSADPSQMQQNTASDQGLHCLQIVQPFFFLGIATSYSLTYLKWNMNSSNI